MIRDTTIGYRWSEDMGDWVLDEEDGENAIILVDDNGDLLYETEESGLWYALIQQNKAGLLSQYLAGYGGIWQGETFYLEPFFVAAASGSTDALRALLEYCAASPVKIRLDERCEFLLHTACRGGYPNTVRFLLENEATFRNIHHRIGFIHDRDRYNMTALLAAAGPSHSQREGEDPDKLLDNGARRDELVRLLLDTGADASDAVSRLDGEQPQAPDQEPQGRLICTVLSQAVAWAKYELVTRLIDSGAQVHTRQQHDYRVEWYNAGPEHALHHVKRVTPLHIAGYYSNLDGVQALLDRRGNNISIVDMVSSPDGFGGLPLHRAAGGPGPLKGYDVFFGNQMIPAPVATIKLLLSGAPNTINCRDIEGRTPLHHAVKTYSRYESKRFDTAKALCENGADASLRDKKGQTPLHVLAKRATAAESIDMALLGLLLAYGARVDDVDADGNTILHFVAQRHDYSNAARVLLS